jgi:hypothetical protein
MGSGGQARGMNLMCNCRERVNKKLAARNAEIAAGFMLTNNDGPTRGMKLSPPMIMLEKVDAKKRGKLPILVAAYCPFCGKEAEKLAK